MKICLAPFRLPCRSVVIPEQKRGCACAERHFICPNGVLTVPVLPMIINIAHEQTNWRVETVFIFEKNTP